MPDESEVLGLLALMLIHDSRREARGDGTVLLGDQDRTLWDAEKIAEGTRLLRSEANGPYQLQAAIAACHTGEQSDWPWIVYLYGELLRVQPTPVVELNRAVAVAMAEGPEAGLEAIERIDSLDGYVYLHTARADLLRRLGRDAESRAAYERALELGPNDAERRFIASRLRSE
jgi:RNA polymerase sigma-70 factor (ECF subfamily)